MDMKSTFLILILNAKFDFFGSLSLLNYPTCKHTALRFNSRKCVSFIYLLGAIVISCNHTCTMNPFYFWWLVRIPWGQRMLLSVINPLINLCGARLRVINLQSHDFALKKENPIHEAVLDEEAQRTISFIFPNNALDRCIQREFKQIKTPCWLLGTVHFSHRRGPRIRI